MIDIDLVEAARGAVFVALAAAHEQANSGAAVLDHAGQDEPVPFVVLDDIEWDNEGGKDDPVLKIIFSVVTIYRGEDRARLLTLMHINFMALHDVGGVGAAVAADGVALHPARLTGGAASGMPPDGVTYAGTQSFELYAEPA